MRAIVVNRWMEPSDLRVGEVPEPPVQAGMLGVEVKAAGCNFSDILLVRGQYQFKPPFPFIPGAEVGGIVREVGPGVVHFKPGDRVLGSIELGAFAERVCVPANAAWKLPGKMTFEEGAALGIVYPTSYAALVDRATLRPAETLLVHAAAGGVGIAAVQIGKALGARVIATGGGEEKLDVARRAGADLAINYRDPSWMDQVRDATDGRGADVIYDSVGGDIFDQSLKCIAWSGRLLVIGFASGRIPEVKANRILLKNISIIGLHWSAYALNEPQRIPEIFDALFRLYEEEKIKPILFKTFPLEEIAAALEALDSRNTHGKVIVAP
jgi:NADPH2:quinone reductase